MKKTNLLKEFKKLTKQEQVEWIETRTKKVISRLPELKQKLTVYDDKSDELYNLESADIQLMSKVHTSRLGKGGSGGTSLPDFLSQLERYSKTDIIQLEQETAQMRWESFLQNAKENASGDGEKEYIDRLAENMSERDIINFTRSKLFFDKGDLNSADFVKFLEQYGIGVGTAKLETWQEQHNIGTDKQFWTADTSTKLGRHKKK